MNENNLLNVVVEDVENIKDCSIVCYECSGWGCLPDPENISLPCFNCHGHGYINPFNTEGSHL